MTGRRILFAHQNFPGQFPHIADALLARGDRVAAIGGRTAKDRPGVDLRRWSNMRGTTGGIFDAATRAEADLIRARAAAGAALALKKDGFVPDVIVGHPGWGETIHLRDIFPDARLILLGEYYYLSRGGDVGFDREFERPTLADDMRITAKNATQALACATADRIMCPTPFQASTFPKAFHPRIRVLHEGLDLDRARRRPDVRFVVSPSVTLDAGTPVITFINRNFERLRGFHIFMRALPAVQAACPDVHVVLIGNETNAGYGAALPGGETWKARMLAEVGERLDLTRLHFTGPVSHDRMIDALSISAAHVYYTYPFVLSWSLIEAMACECLILGSDTGPVRDAIRDGGNGVLNDFFDVDALSRAMVDAIRAPERFRAMRTAARNTALQSFDRASVGVPGWLRVIDEVLEEAGRGAPAGGH